MDTIMICPKCFRHSETEVCPKCGVACRVVSKEDYKKSGSLFKWCFPIGLILVVGGLFYMLAKTPGCSGAPGSAANVGAFTVRASTLGCENLEDYKRLARLANDLSAFDSLMKQYVVAGACRWLPVGESAVMEDYRMGDDAAKVRVRGETRSFWVAGKSAK